MRKDLSFDQLMTIYNHIAQEEQHFNNLEMEYRKLASQWLLVSLGAIGFVITKQDIVPFNIWGLVIGICLAATVGILVLWMLDIKVYHELLHSAFREGVLLEKQYADILPAIRTRMVSSQAGGDIIRRVIYFYFFSVLLLLIIANVAIWMIDALNVETSIIISALSLLLTIIIFHTMSKGPARKFELETEEKTKD